MAKKKAAAHEKNKKEEKKVDYLTLSIFIILIAGITLIAFKPELIGLEKRNNNPTIDPEETRYVYNGFSFVKEAGIWYTQIEKEGIPYVIMTEYGPKEVEDMKVTYNQNLFPALTHAGDTLYLTFDPTEENKSDVTIAAVDFAKGLSIVYHLNIKSACTINTSECPIVQTCNTTDRAVIEIIRDDEPRAEYNGNCLKVYGKNSDLIKLVNRLMFEWYGIISVDETGQVFRS